MKFGTSGLRGLVVDLDGRASALYAEAFARYLITVGAAKPGSPVLIGRDFRWSSPGISATCIGALTRAGLAPVDCGAIPTPALALYGMSLNAACLMVTGSHIPDDRNGIKFYRPDGEIDKYDEAGITAIATQLGSREIDFTPRSALDRSAEAEALFIARNMKLLPKWGLKGLKIGVYQHSTVARDLFVKVLNAYGADVVPLGRSNRFIPVDTEAVSAETISLLKGWVKEYGLDAIVSADGDGDRPLITDETGAPLPGDLIGLIAAQFLGAHVLVTPVTSNSGIDKAGSFSVIRTKVGSPFVIAGMQEAVTEGHPKVVGFEANGGMLTASAFTVVGGNLAPLPTRDSFLPALATLHWCVEHGEPLSAIAAGSGLPFTAADRLENYPVDASAALISHLRDSNENIAAFLSSLGVIASTSYVDGIRTTFIDGRIVHLRPSGNAPEMRCYIEAGSKEEATTLLHQALDLIRNWTTETSR